MKLMIIRHGEPDYSIDSLTSKGWREAEYLADRMEKTEVTEFYVSPLGRAKATAKPTLERTGRTAVELEWLREFRPRIVKPGIDTEGCIWDWLPGIWTKDERNFDHQHWLEMDIMQEAGVKAEYDRVCDAFDAFLARHGYRRDGYVYRAEHANHDTIVFFCHFGIECVLLSHILNIPFMTLVHGTCAQPSSVSTIYTEERRQGIASFRMASFGDTSHLYVKNEAPSFMARFKECFDDCEGDY